MTTDLDRAIRSTLGDIIATAPEPDDQPMRLMTDDSEMGMRRPYLVAAASLVVLAGVAGLYAIGTNDATPVTPAATPTATDDSAAPATTLPDDTASPAAVNTTPNCAITGAQALVPNVAGLPWVEAADVLATAGLEQNALPELPPPLETPDADYVIIRQAKAPGTTTSCGAVVDITVAYRPGPLHTVQEGDTYESIAASQSITVAQLLAFNGMTITKLEASGQSPTTPLALGQALRLSHDPATLNTDPEQSAPRSMQPTTTTP